MLNVFENWSNVFWVLNFDLSDALTLRGVKFWLSNAQPGLQFLMNDAYFSTEFERIWNTILTQRCISIGNFRHRTPYTFVAVIAHVGIYIWCTHAHLFSNILIFKFIVLINKSYSVLGYQPWCRLGNCITYTCARTFQISFATIVFINMSLFII